ncbi:MAG: hypothetical protein LBQ13_00680 [Endomicrobium sp.]|jgi:hypothetical protein|nr:hypothetical protein [Endomicrobium sp.]
MDTRNQKTIVVIEDNIDDFHKIKSGLERLSFEVIPNDDKAFSDLSGYIKAYFNNTDRDGNKKQIETILQDQNIIGFVIDYLLVGNTGNNNDGIAFYNNFIKDKGDKTILFASGATAPDDWNDMFKKIDEINVNRTIAHLFMKNKRTDWTSSFNNRINKMFNTKVKIDG